MTLPAWLPVLLAIPTLLLGEWMTRRVGALGRFNIPAPVVGGLAVSALILLLGLTGAGDVRFVTKTDAAWWTWLVTTETEWAARPAKNVTLPLMVGFFTCIGLNATWDVLRRGSGQVLLFLLIGTALAVAQNGIGVALAHALGVDPLLGLVCGSMTMTGGHGTAIGFAPILEKEGLASAAVLGAAAATVGLVTGGLIGGPVGVRLIRRFALRSDASTRAHLPIGEAGDSGILHDLRAVVSLGAGAAGHVLLVLVCIKAGASVSHFIELSGLKFPPHIGAMVLGVVLRNVFDLGGRSWIRSETVDVIASLCLAFFLTVAMMSLNLGELTNAAVPMLVILSVQVVVMALFATWVTFRVMGRDYDAAVMAAGHCGFGLGATPNAVANMKSLVDRFGPAPRAFLIIPLVGAVLIDFANSLNITLFLNLVR
jgi:ESS family glutamate:Na+ symporter